MLLSTISSLPRKNVNHNPKHEKSIQHPLESNCTAILFSRFISNIFAGQKFSRIRESKKRVQKERENIFIQALHLSTTQASVFHVIYVDFNREKSSLDGELFSLIVKYGDNYQKLDATLMSAFIKQSENYQRKELALRKKYYSRLSKAISVELASQFYEVDDFVSTSLRMNVLSGLPFTQSIAKLLATQSAN